MPELSGLDDEEADISDQGARDRDTQKKQANKDYVDKKFHAKERDVREGDLVLLEQKRQNKLSSSYEKEPYEVMTRYGDQVVLRLSNGGEYKRSMQHIKPFNIPDHERAAAASASATQVMAPVTPITAPAPAEIPRMSLPPAAVEIPPEVPVSGVKSFPCTHKLDQRTGQVWRDNSRRVQTHEKNSGETVRRLGTMIQSIFCAQSGAGVRLNV